MKEFLNTEITQTWGSQLIFLIVTITLTLLIGMIVQDVKNKIAIFTKAQLHRYRNKPIRMQKKIYKEIKRHEKINKDSDTFPTEWPSGMNSITWMSLKDVLDNGKHLKYGKLENIIIQYEKSFPERLEKYYKDNPEKKVEKEKRDEKTRESMLQMQSNLKQLSNIDWNRFK